MSDEKGSFQDAFGDLSPEKQRSQAATLLAMVTFLTGFARAIEPITKMISLSTSQAFNVFVDNPEGIDADPVECVDLASDDLGNSLFGGLCLVHECILFMKKTFHPSNDLVEDALSMVPFMAKSLSSAGVGTEEDMLEQVMEMMDAFLTVHAQEIAMDGEE